MTKPTKIALGIGVATLACAAAALATTGVPRLLWAWTTLACAVACGAYVRNRPHWLGKRRGRMTARAVVVLPYLVAFRTACRLMAWSRGPDRPSRVAPGVFVGGRVAPATIPAEVGVVVDLVAEYAAHPGVRRLAGYRSLTVLDGGVPADEDAFVALVHEVAAADCGVLVHCDSGRGRAPTFAAALLVARGDADDVADALVRLRAGRPVVAPTRIDLAFLARVAPRVRRVVAVAVDDARVLG